MKSYGSGAPPRVRRPQPPGSGRVFSQGIDWVGIVKQIEEEGHLGEWVSPDSLQALPNLMSVYNTAKSKGHPDLRALASQGYVITPATTNTTNIDGKRFGDVVLMVTKEN